MPLQNTGAISASQIQAEFGGTNIVSMSEYYRGGANVPNEVFCHNNTIPAAGGISFANFYNTTKGKLYYDYTASFTLAPLPANTRRAQVYMVGGGGGGAARGGNQVRFGSRCCAAGGGSGGYSISTINAIRDNGEYITGEVGGGGGAKKSSGAGRCEDPCGRAGSGGGTVVRRRNSAATIIENSAVPGGGGGGFIRFGVAAGDTGAVGGGGGGGNAANGGAGTAQRSRDGNLSTTVGQPGASVAFDRGGGGYADATRSDGRRGDAGVGGFIRVRI